MSITNTFKKIMKKQFVRNVVTVASGTALAQVVIMLFSPLITRIYGPEVYGVYGVFASLISILVPITALTYPTAIVLPRESSEAKSLAKLSFIVICIISVILAIIFLLFGELMLSMFNMEILIPFVLFIPLIMFFDGIFQITQQWLIRTKQFQVKARVAVKQSLVVNAGNTILGIFYPLSSTLIVIATIGKGLYAYMLASGAGIVKNIKVFFSFSVNRESFKSMITLAKKYSDFPKYRAPQVLINGLSESLPVLMLTTFFGPAVAAFYTIGVKVLGIPTQLVGNAVGDVFYPRITEAANNKENIAGLLFKANIILAIVGVIPFGMIVIFGPWLFSLVYGSDWVIAGEYARWLAFWSYFMLITRPTIKTLPVLGEQRFHLVFTIVTILARLIALIIGAYLFSNDKYAVILYSIVGAILYIVLAVITIIKCKSYSRKKHKIA